MSFSLRLEGPLREPPCCGWRRLAADKTWRDKDRLQSAQWVAAK